MERRQQIESLFQEALQRPAKALFPAPIFGGSRLLRSHEYDVTGDGQRFLINSAPLEESGASSPITVVLNWQAALKK
ncbi:MAG TPA: hypothetical protein VE959_07090 [Bryobacteraceae bacterium]|nr:hypothetical protein [Bryobacteraceae bacterium]